MLKQWEQEKDKIKDSLIDMCKSDNQMALTLENMNFEELDDSIVDEALPTLQLSVGTGNGGGFGGIG